MSDTLIAIVTDSHLAARAPECTHNWQAAAQAVVRARPRFSVHLGDITLDGQVHPEDMPYAADLLAEWPTELRCLPGNHDMGDGSGERPLVAAELAAYEAAFGSDHWTAMVGDWRLIGIDAQLLGTGSEQERRQWQWLEQLASERSAPQPPTVLLTHRPIALPPGEERTRAGRYVPAAARERLLDGPLSHSLRMVLSGHTHQYLDWNADGVRHVWVPSTAFVLPDAMQPRVGEKPVGLGLLDLGGVQARFDLVVADGMRRHDLTTLPFWQQMRAEQAQQPSVR